MLFGPIKYLNPPREGGKYGSLKSTNGITIMVPPDLLQLFALGTTVEISTKQQTWGAGTQDERLVTIATSGPLQGNTGSVQNMGPSLGYQAANQGAANQRPNTGFQPRVVQGGGTPPQADQARHIFITGVVGRAMGSGKFTASEIPVLTQAAGEAYDRLLDRTRPVPVAPPPADVPGLEPGDPGPGLQ
jgi:hypothetical protein